jgi:hypothetical protein
VSTFLLGYIPKDEVYSKYKGYTFYDVPLVTDFIYSRTKLYFQLHTHDWTRLFGFYSVDELTLRSDSDEKRFFTRKRDKKITKFYSRLVLEDATAFSTSNTHFKFFHRKKKEFFKIVSTLPGDSTVSSKALGAVIKLFQLILSIKSNRGGSISITSKVWRYIDYYGRLHFFPLPLKYFFYFIFHYFVLNPLRFLKFLLYIPIFFFVYRVMLWVSPFYPLLSLIFFKITGPFFKFIKIFPPILERLKILLYPLIYIYAFYAYSMYFFSLSWSYVRNLVRNQFLAQYFDLFFKLFVRVRFHRFFTRDEPESIFEEERPCTPTASLYDDDNAEELIHFYEYDASGADSIQTMEGREIFYFDTDVYGDEQFDSDDYLEYFYERDMSRKRDQNYLDAIPNSYTFFETDVKEEEEELFNSLIHLWLMDDVKDLEAETVFTYSESNYTLGEDVSEDYEDQEAIDELDQHQLRGHLYQPYTWWDLNLFRIKSFDKQYWDEDDHWFTPDNPYDDNLEADADNTYLRQTHTRFYDILPDPVSRKKYLKSAYNLSKSLDKWYDVNRNHKFIHVPRHFFGTNSQIDYRKPIDFEQWQKLTWALLPLLTKRFERRTLTSPKKLKEVWDRLDYEIKKNPNRFIGKLEDPENPIFAHLDREFTEKSYSKPTLIFKKITTFFYGIGALALGPISFINAKSLKKFIPFFGFKEITVKRYEAYTLAIMAVKRANTDFSSFYRLYVTHMADTPNGDAMINFLILKSQLDIPDQKVYRFIDPWEKSAMAPLREHVLKRALKYVFTAPIVDFVIIKEDDPLGDRHKKLKKLKKPSKFLHTSYFSYSRILMFFCYDYAVSRTKSIVDYGTNWTGKLRDILDRSTITPRLFRYFPYEAFKEHPEQRGSDNIIFEDPFENGQPIVKEDLIPGGSDSEDYFAPDPSMYWDENYGWEFLIPFLSKLEEQFFDPYVNAFYLPETFSYIVEDYFEELDGDEDEELDFNDEYLTIHHQSIDFYDAQESATPYDGTGTLYSDDMDELDAMDPTYDDGTIMGVEDSPMEDFVQHHKLEDDPENYVYYEFDTEFFIYENIEDNEEEWEPDSFEEANDVSPPLSRLILGNLVVQPKTFPATDLRLFLGPLSEISKEFLPEADTDPNYKVNKALMVIGNECKAVVVYQSICLDSVQQLVEDMRKKKAIEKRWLFRLYAFCLKSFTVFSYWLFLFTEQLMPYDFAPYNIPQGKYLTLYRHFIKFRKVYDHSTFKSHSEFVKAWVEDFERFAKSSKDHFRANLQTGTERSTESRYHYFKDPYGRYYYQIPFVTDQYFDNDPDNELFFEHLRTEAEQIYDYFDLFDKSRFLHIDELENTLSGNSTPAEIFDITQDYDIEMGWDWGSLSTYAVDEDFYPEAHEFISKVDIFVSAIYDYLAILGDYYLYLTNLFFRLHVVGRFFYLRESIENFWLTMALKYGRWVYLVRQGAVSSIFFATIIYVFFVIPRISYLLTLSSENYALLSFINAMASIFAVIILCLFAIGSLYKTFKEIPQMERFSLYCMFFLFWFYYGLFGYLRPPFGPFTEFGPVYNFLDDHHMTRYEFPMHRAHVMGPERYNYTLEADQAFYFYGMDDNERNLGNTNEQRYAEDALELAISYSYSKAPITPGQLWVYFRYYFIGLYHSYFTNFQFYRESYNRVYRNDIRFPVHTILHRPYLINFQGLDRRPEVFYEVFADLGTRMSAAMESAIPFYYRYYPADREVRYTRMRHSHYYNSQYLPDGKDYIVYYPYDWAPKTLDFEYDFFFPEENRSYANNYIYNDFIKPNPSKLSAPSERIKQRRYSKFFDGATQSTSFKDYHLQNRAYNFNQAKVLKRYLWSSYSRKNTPNDFHYLATYYNWYKDRAKKIAGAYTFSRNFIFFLLSHYPNFDGPHRELYLPADTDIFRGDLIKPIRYKFHKIKRNSRVPRNQEVYIKRIYYDFETKGHITKYFRYKVKEDKDSNSKVLVLDRPIAKTFKQQMGKKKTKYFSPAVSNSRIKKIHKPISFKDGKYTAQKVIMNSGKRYLIITDEENFYFKLLKPNTFKKNIDFIRDTNVEDEPSFTYLEQFKDRLVKNELDEISDPAAKNDPSVLRKIRDKTDIYSDYHADYLEDKYDEEKEFEFFDPPKYVYSLFDEHVWRPAIAPSPRIKIDEKDREWFIERMQEYRRFHNFMNNFIMMNTVDHFNYFHENFSPFLSDNPYFRTFVYDKYSSSVMGIRKDKIYRRMMDKFWEKPNWTPEQRRYAKKFASARLSPNEMYRPSKKRLQHLLADEPNFARVRAFNQPRRIRNNVRTGTHWSDIDPEPLIPYRRYRKNFKKFRYNDAKLAKKWNITPAHPKARDFFNHLHYSRKLLSSDLTLHPNFSKKYRKYFIQRSVTKKPNYPRVTGKAIVKEGLKLEGNRIVPRKWHNVVKPENDYDPLENFGENDKIFPFDYDYFFKADSWGKPSHIRNSAEEDLREFWHEFLGPTIYTLLFAPAYEFQDVAISYIVRPIQKSKILRSIFGPIDHAIQFMLYRAKAIVRMGFYYDRHQKRYFMTKYKPIYSKEDPKKVIRYEKVAVPIKDIHKAIRRIDESFRYRPRYKPIRRYDQFLNRYHQLNPQARDRIHRHLRYKFLMKYFEEDGTNVEEKDDYRYPDFDDDDDMESDSDFRPTYTNLRRLDTFHPPLNRFDDDHYNNFDRYLIYKVHKKYSYEYNSPAYAPYGINMHYRVPSRVTKRLISISSTPDYKGSIIRFNMSPWPFTPRMKEVRSEEAAIFDYLDEDFVPESDYYDETDEDLFYYDSEEESHTTFPFEPLETTYSSFTYDNRAINPIFSDETYDDPRADEFIEGYNFRLDDETTAFPESTFFEGIGQFEDARDDLEMYQDVYEAVEDFINVSYLNQLIGLQEKYFKRTRKKLFSKVIYSSRLRQLLLNNFDPSEILLYFDPKSKSTKRAVNRLPYAVESSRFEPIKHSVIDSNSVIGINYDQLEDEEELFEENLSEELVDFYLPTRPSIELDSKAVYRRSYLRWVNREHFKKFFEQQIAKKLEIDKQVQKKRQWDLIKDRQRRLNKISKRLHSKSSRTKQTIYDALKRTSKARKNAVAEQKYLRYVEHAEPEDRPMFLILNGQRVEVKNPYAKLAIYRFLEEEDEHVENFLDEYEAWEDEYFETWRNSSNPFSNSRTIGLWVARFLGIEPAFIPLDYDFYGSYELGAYKVDRQIRSEIERLKKIQSKPESKAERLAYNIHRKAQADLVSHYVRPQAVINKENRANERKRIRRIRQLKRSEKNILEEYNRVCPELEEKLRDPEITLDPIQYQIDLYRATRYRRATESKLKAIREELQTLIRRPPQKIRIAKLNPPVGRTEAELDAYNDDYYVPDDEYHYPENEFAPDGKRVVESTERWDPELGWGFEDEDDYDDEEWEEDEEYEDEEYEDVVFENFRNNDDN